MNRRLMGLPEEGTGCSPSPETVGPHHMPIASWARSYPRLTLAYSSTVAEDFQGLDMMQCLSLARVISASRLTGFRRRKGISSGLQQKGRSINLAVARSGHQIGCRIGPHSTAAASLQYPAPWRGAQGTIVLSLGQTYSPKNQLPFQLRSGWFQRWN